MFRVAAGSTNTVMQLDIAGDYPITFLTNTTERGRFSATAFTGNNIDLVCNTAAKGLVLKDTQGTPHYWRVTISNLGVLTTADIGTSAP
jgi:hypothetical protein